MSLFRALLRPLGAALVAGALVAGSATPAAAVPFDLDTDGVTIEPYTWNLSSTPFGVASASYSVSGQSYTDAWDSTAFSLWSEDERNESALPHTFLACGNPQLSAADADGDYVVTCDPQVSNLGLELQGEARLYAEGDLVRTLVTVRNPTGAPIDFSWAFAADFFGGSSQRATSTSPTLGSVATTASDRWVYNAEANSLNAVLAWGLDGAGLPVERTREAETSSITLVSDRDADGTQITLAAGQSVAFALFQKLDPAGTAASRAELFPFSAPADAPTDDAASSPEPAEFQAADATSSTEAIQAATAEFSAFTGRLARGIPADVVVANWQPLPDPKPELALTGSNTAVVIGGSIAAGALLLLGVLLLVLRRRTRGRQQL